MRGTAGATPETHEAGDATPAGEGQPVETLNNRPEGMVGTAPTGSGMRLSESARMEILDRYPYGLGTWQLVPFPHRGPQ